MLYQLIYASALRGKPTWQEYEALLRQVRDNNRRRGITGAMVCHGGQVLQVLEGPESAVLRLMGVIADDERHANIRILSALRVGRRDFAGDYRACRAIDRNDPALRDILRQATLPLRPGRRQADSTAGRYLRNFCDAVLPRAAA